MKKNKLKQEYKYILEFFKKHGDQLNDTQIEAIISMFAVSIYMKKPIPNLCTYLDKFPIKEEDQTYTWNLLKRKL